MLVSWGKMVEIEANSRFWKQFEGIADRFCQMNQQWGIREEKQMWPAIEKMNYF